ncbi:MAG TPA: fatty acid desaturase [Frankiaceae bacterium]|jgi:stearoyl-CoA desaturase (delta-9 desaturase)|nr:fatty acid desaturase [Frankiaceae bacterium]
MSSTDVARTRPVPPFWGTPKLARSAAQRAQLAVTLLIVLLPLAGVVVVATALVGGVSLVDLVLLAAFYVVTGLGLTAGYHRLFTHRSFTPNPPLKVALAVAGGMCFEGGVISWVATHRRHHAFADRPGDPHSPYRYGRGSAWGQLRGLGHAHLGWLFGADTTSVSQYAPDLQADPLLRRIDRAFPLLCLVSLGLPTLAGWLLTGTWQGAIGGLLWGGLVRVFLLHHVTWSVNSLCHVVGSRPFRTHRDDRATNLWPLALVSFGDSWHNLHHADPTSARHGVEAHQVDIAAGFIRICERLGWATRVQWPGRSRVEAHRR